MRELSRQTLDSTAEIQRSRAKRGRARINDLASMEASDSGEKEIGDYIVGYAIEEAEGLYHLSGGTVIRYAACFSRSRTLYLSCR